MNTLYIIIGTSWRYRKWINRRSYNKKQKQKYESYNNKKIKSILLVIKIKRLKKNLPRDFDLDNHKFYVLKYYAIYFTDYTIFLRLFDARVHVVQNYNSTTVILSLNIYRYIDIINITLISTCLRVNMNKEEKKFCIKMPAINVSRLDK